MTDPAGSIPPAVAPRGPETAPRAFNKASAALFGLAALLALAYGILYMFSGPGVSVSAEAGGRGDQDVRLIAAQGEPVDVTDHLVDGKFTVIDFYADWCLSCREIGPWLERVARAREELVLRKVNVVSWSTPVVARYRISSLPYLQMYDPEGRLIADGADAVMAEIKRRF